MALQEVASVPTEEQDVVPLSSVVQMAEELCSAVQEEQMVQGQELPTAVWRLGVHFQLLATAYR